MDHHPKPKRRPIRRALGWTLRAIGHWIAVSLDFNDRPEPESRPAKPARSIRRGR